MSRYTVDSPDFRFQVSYGFDPVPMGGYFFEVRDNKSITLENEEGIILSEGLLPGIERDKMLGLMLDAPDKWGIQRTSLYERHFARIFLNMPI